VSIVRDVFLTSHFKVTTDHPIIAEPLMVGVHKIEIYDSDPLVCTHIKLFAVDTILSGNLVFRIFHKNVVGREIVVTPSREHRLSRGDRVQHLKYETSYERIIVSLFRKERGQIGLEEFHVRHVIILSLVRSELLVSFRNLWNRMGEILDVF
jgi:hypothetical protein